MGLRSHGLISYRFDGRIASLMLILVLLAVSSFNASGQNYWFNNECTGGAVLASQVLKEASTGNGTMIPAGDLTGGFLTASNGLVLEGNNENAIIYGTNSNSAGQLIEWHVNGKIYNIKIKELDGSAGAPTVIDFYAVNPAPCTKPYDANAILSITGGFGDYDVSIEDEASAIKYTNTLASPVENLPLVIETGLMSDKTYTITTVSDEKGCIADVRGVSSISYSTADIPQTFQLQDINGSTNVSGCSSTGVDLYLSNSEEQVTYNVYSGSTHVLGPVAGNATGKQLFLGNVSTIGVTTYYVEATHDNSGCQKVMGNMTVTLSNAPVASIADGTVFEKCFGSPDQFDITLNITPIDQGPWNVIISDGTNDYAFVANTFDDTWRTPNLQATKTFTIKSVEDRNGCVNTENNGSAQITVNPKPAVTLVGPDRVCLGSSINLATSVAPVGINIVDYDWSTGAKGPGLDNIDVTPSIQPIHTYDVTVTSDKGCVGSAAKNITVNSLPAVSFTAPQYVFCQNDAAVTLSSIPAAGGSYNIGAAVFDPAAQPLGNQTVIYTYTDVTTGCTNSASRIFSVNPIPAITIDGITDGDEYCADAGILDISASPDGSGGGVPGTFDCEPRDALYFVDNGDGTASFNTAAAIAIDGSRDYTISYTYASSNGCEATRSVTISVNPNLNNIVNFSGLAPFYCGDKPMEEVTLTGNVPNEGIFTISPAWAATGTDPAFEDNNDGTATFFPNKAGGGAFDITYEYTDDNGCTGRRTYSTTVGATLEFELDGQTFCQGDPVQTLSATPEGGDFSIVAPGGTVHSPIDNGNDTWFDPATRMPGIYQITYRYNNGTGCLTSQTYPVEIKKAPYPGFSIDGTGKYCEQQGPVKLTKVTSNPGVFTGNGVTEQNNVYYFNPDIAGPGTHTITFTTDSLGCRSSDSMEVEVVTSPVLDIQVDPSLIYCDNEPGVIIEGLVDGTASLTGNFTSSLNPSGASLVANENAEEGINANDGRGWLNPEVGPGNYDVTYIYEHPGNGCVYQHTENIEILQSDGANFNGINNGAVLCQGTGIVYLYGLLPNGGEGRFPTQNPNDPMPDASADPDKNTGVVNSGSLDGEASFDTRLLTPGTYTLLYEYTNAAGCTNYSEKKFTIVEGPVDVYQVTGGGAYCVDDEVATRGVFIGIDGSTEGVTYELRLGGTTVQSLVGPAGGGPINFANRVTKVGTYSVWARLGDCEAPMTGNVNVEVYDLLLQLDGVDAVKHVSCFGANDGEVKLTASGGSGNYIFEYSLNGGAWILNPNTTPDHFINLVPGDYQFRISDQSAAACALPAGREVSITINSAAAPLDVAYTQLSRNGCDCSTTPEACDGSAILSITGGTKFTDLSAYPSGYLVEWPATVTNLSADLLAASQLPEGNYTVNVTDANGCSATIIVEIEKEADLSLILNNQTDNQCFGTNSAKANVTAAGGSGQYQFSYDGGTNWTLPTSTATYETGVLATGTHTILVRDSEHPHCTAGFEVTIVGPSNALDVTVSSTGETCAGEADGFVTLSITGGTAPYRYQLDGAGAILTVPANLEIHDIANGAHTITIFDDNNCSVNEVFTIEKAPVINLSGVVTDASCDSNADGKVELSANPANVNYVYSIDVVNWQSSPVFDYLSADTYNFQVRDNVKGCTAEFNDVVINDYPAIIVNPATAISDVICFGEANGSFTANVSGGQVGGSFEYAIFLDADGHPVYQDSPVFSNLSSGTYDIWVRNKGTLCEVHQSDYAIINNPTAPLSVSLTSKTDIECVGGTAEIDIAVNGGWDTGYKYQWRNKVTNENFGTSEDLSQALTGKRIAGGTYQVVVTDANGCTYTFEETVTEPSAWSASVSTTPNTITNAASDPAIVGNGSAALSPVSGGSDPANYSYEWFNSSNTSIATEVTSISNLDPGSYYVIITTSVAGCDHRVDFVIGDTTVPLVFNLSKEDAACFGENGKLIISITGGTPDYSIEYQRNADPVQTISSTSANYHEIDATAGDYSVTVRDANGGRVTKLISIDEPDEFTVQGIESYDNCEAQIDVTISETDNYRVTWVVPAGAPAISTPDVTSGNSFSESGLTYAGDYIVTVENIASGCIQSDIITLREPKITVVEDLTQHKDLLCNGADNGYLAVNVTGREPGHAFNYVWQNVTTGAPSIDMGSTPSIGSANSVDAGKWQVTVTSTDGCTTILKDMIITEPAPLTLSDPVVKNITTCSTHEAGQVTVSVTGGTAPYTVTVTNGTISKSQTLSVSSFTFTDLPASDNYSVTVVDANACAPILREFTISGPEPVSVTNVDGSISCYGMADGVISFDITGGVQDPISNHNVYDLVITGDNGFNLGTQIDVLAIPMHSYSLPDLEPGTYTIKVWDNLAAVDPTSGCSDPAFETMVTLSHVEVSESIIHQTCPGGVNDGSIELSVSGSGDYSWTWTYPDGSKVTSPGSINQYNLAAGKYVLSITDNVRKCPLPPLEYLVDYQRQVEITNWELKDVDCYNEANGSITNIVHNARVSPVYTWTGVAAGNENLTEQTNLGAGYYQLVIEEPGTGCSATETFEIQQPETLHFNLLNNLSCSPFNQRIFVDGLSGGNGNKANYTYQWVGPNGNLLPFDTEEINVTKGGLYTVTVTDARGLCSLTKSILIEGEMTVVVSHKQNVSCFDETDGLIEVNIVGGPTDRQFVYNWEVFDGSNWVSTGTSTANASLTGIGKGVYRVVVSAVNAVNYPCSVTSADIQITEPLEVDYVNINPIDISTCSTAATGTIELAVTGGSGVYRLDYTGDNVTDLVSNDGLFRVENLTEGMYQLRLTDANGCATNPVIEEVTINAPEPLVLTVDNVATTIACDTEGSGVIEFDISGGNKDASGNPHYEITVTGQTVRDVYAEGTVTYDTDLNSGTYVIKVVDRLASTQSACTQLEETITLELLTVDGLVIDNTCASTTSNVGAIRNISISGADDYDWKWDEVNGDPVSDHTSLNQENLAAGTYVLNVTDNERGCSVSKSFVVGTAVALDITGVAVPVTCYGANDGKISAINISGTVDYSFNWSGPASVDNTRIDAQENLQPGSYLVEVVDNTNGCRVNKTWLIEEPTPITYDLELVVESCDPYERGINVVNPAGGNTDDPSDFTYTWRGPSNEIYKGQTITGLTKGGIYQVTVADNNCGVTQSIDIPEELVITPSITELNCNGNVNGAIAISITGGSGNFSYQWTKDGVPYSEQPDISGLDAATYELTVTDNSETDGSACTYTWSYALKAPDAIEVTGTVGDIICNGDDNGHIAINVTGGSGVYNYTWTTVDGAGLVPANQNQSGLSGGTYSVVVEDTKGCVSDPFDFEVEELEPIDFTYNLTDADCDGANGAIDVTPTGGSLNYAYHWSASNGGVVNASDKDQQDLSGLISGTYMLKVWDADPLENRTGCFVEKIIHLTKPLSIETTVKNQGCAGTENGQIDLIVSGGTPPYSFEWTTVNGSGAKLAVNAQNQSGLSAGTYTVEVTDSRVGGACVKSFDIEVGIDSNIEIVSNTSPVNCNGGSDGSITLVQVSGGLAGNYSYSWTGSGTGLIQGQRNQTALSAGSYVVTVTDDDTGCTMQETFTVAQPVALSLSVDKLVDVLCKGQASGEISVEASGGTPFINGAGDPYYDYVWVGPASSNVIQNSATQTGLAAGNYSVTVKDANGCSSEMLEIEIQEPAAALSATLDNVVDVSAKGGNDGQIFITVSGGTGGKTITWSGSDLDGNPIPDITQNTVNPRDLVAGTYQVVVVDDNKCEVIIDGIVVEEPDMPLTMTVLTDHIRPCHGDGTGAISVTANGGTAPYTITLFDSGNNVVQTVNADALNQNNLAADMYRIEIRDDGGNTISRNEAITEPAPLVISANVTQHVECYNETTGSMVFRVEGGLPSASNHYKVTITGPQGYHNVLDNIEENIDYPLDALPAGAYWLSVIDDSNGDGAFVLSENCSEETTATINQLGAVVDVDNDATICVGQTTALQLTVSNYPVSAANPLEVTLSDGTTATLTAISTVVNVNPIVTTEYSVVAIEDGGCPKGPGNNGSSATVVVNDQPIAQLTLAGDSEICEEEATSLRIRLVEGTAPWSVTYTDGATSTTLNDIADRSTIVAVSPLVSSTYSLVSVTDANGCSGLVAGTVDIAVNELPSASMSVLPDNSNICQGTKSALEFTFPTGSPDYSVTISENGVNRTFNATPLVGNTYSLSVSPDETTVYQLVAVADSKGCSVPISGGTSITINVLNNPADAGVITGKMVACQGSTATYSVAEIADADSYLWTVPADMGTIVTGNGTNTITVEFLTNFTGNGHITVSGVNSCSTGLSSSIGVTASLLPAKPTMPSGPVNICEEATGLRYRIDPVSNASTYTWSIPEGLEFVGEHSGTEVVLQVKSAYNNFVGEITVTASNACGDGLTSDPLLVTVSPLPTANAGTDEYGICSSTHQLNAVDPGAGYTGQWTVTKGTARIVAGEENLYNAHISGISHGENTFVWTVTNNTTGCSASDEVRLYNDQVVISAAADNNTVCDGEVTVVGTAIYPEASHGYWTIIAGSGNIETPSAATTRISNLGDGLNTLEWTIVKNGCESKATVDVFNNQPTVPVIFDKDGNPATVIDLVCHENFTELSATAPVLPGETGTWRVVSGSANIGNDPNAASISVTEIARGETTITYTMQNSSCIEVATVVLRNNELIVSAGDDETQCSDTYQLDGTVPGQGVTGQWSIPAGLGAGVFDNGTSPTATISDLARGANTLRWTLTKNGCDSFDEIVITNNSSTTATVGAGQVICAYETTLSGNTPSVVLGETGYWSVIKGSGTFEDVNDPVTQVSGLAHGENIFRWTIVHNGCSSFADLVVNNLHVDVYAGKDTIICGKTVTLMANTPLPGDMGEWSLIAGVGGGTFKPTDINNPNILIGGLDYGKNGFVWTINNEGCTSSDSIFVTNNNPYYIDSSGDKREISAGDSQEVTSSNAVMVADAPEVGAGYWTLVSGGGDIADPLNAGSLITNLREGESVFRWTVTNGTCSYSSDVTITNGAVEQANAGQRDTTCTGEIKLNANEPINALGEWSVIEGKGNFEDKTKFNTMVNNLDKGENHFVWTLYNGSTQSKDTVVIVNNMVAQAYAGLDKPICNTDTFELSAIAPEAGRGTAQWSVVSGGGAFDNPTSPTTIVRSLGQGDNVLKYRISLNSCFSEAYVTISNNTPTTPDAGEDQVSCTDSVQLLRNTPAFGVGEWSVASGYADADPLKNDWAKKLAPGKNLLVWTIDNNNCRLSDTVSIQNNKPSQAFAGHDREVCEDQVYLSANNPEQGVGHWELVAGSGVIADPLDRNTLVTGLGNGVNRFKWIIDNNDCFSTDEVDINFNLIEAFAGYDDTICEDYKVLSANAAFPGTGTWGVAAGAGTAVFDDPNDPYTTVRGLQPGPNELLWTISYGRCSSTSKVIITNDSPSTAFAGDNQSLCVSNATVLSANDPARGDGEWTILNGSASFSSMIDHNPTVSDLAFGDNIFRWTVTHNECKSYSDVMVSYNRIEAYAGENDELCTDDTQLSADPANPGVGTWSVVGGTSQAIFEDINNPNSKVSNLAKGNNVLRWTVNYRGCKTNSEVVLTNNSPSTAYAGNYQELCDDNTTLNATTPYPGTGIWEVLMGSATIADVTNARTAVTGLSKGDNVFRWTVSNGECASTDEVRIVNNEPSIPYAGKDDETCNNHYRLKAETPLFGNGLWSIEQGSGNFDDPTNPTATISNLNPGTNILKWTITQGQCDLSHSITIMNNAADIANAGPDIQDCKDWSVLDANTPQTGFGTGQWSLVSGKGEFDDSSNAKTTIRNLGFGENILMWTITHGSCFSSDQVTIFNKTPDQAAAGDDRSTCEDYIVLNANIPVDGIGQWTVVSGQGTFEDPSMYNTRVNEIGFGDNIYKWTIAYGDCITEDVVVINSNKTYPYAGEDDVVYEPVYTMQAQNPGQLSGVWTVVAGNGVFDDPNFFNTTVRNLSVGKNTFRWTINSADCEHYDEITIEYKEMPEAGFTVDTEEGCYPLEVNFTNYSVGGTDFRWEFGDGGTTTERSPKYTYNYPGTYIAVLTVGGPDGNDVVFTQEINVHDHPVADFDVGPETVYLPQDEIRCYDMSINAVNWLWEFGDGQTSNERNPSYTYSNEGLYTVTLTVQNALGCEHSMVKEGAVKALLSGYVEFPNAFKPRPGGAGNSGTIGERNDAIFKPKHRDVESYHIQIFNRWGQLIFESDNVDEGWDGNYKGQLAPQAVYVYKVSGKFTNGREFSKAGSILLVR